MSEGKKRNAGISEEEKLFKRIAGQMKRDRLLFCFLVIRPFYTLALFVCVCVCIVEYGWYTHIHSSTFCMCSFKNLKVKRYHAGWGGEKQKRHAVGSAAVVCGAVVVVVWRCPFDDAKAPRTN